MYMKEKMATLEEIFSNIPDDAQVVNVKWNYEAFLYEPGKDKEELAYARFWLCELFIKEQYGEILHFSCGYHENGKNHKPHFHFHFIIRTPFELLSPSVRCNRKRKFLERRTDEEGLVFMHGDDVPTFKFAPLDLSKPKWSTLSYPLKEGKALDVCNFYSFDEDTLSLLLKVGSEIYRATNAIHERKDKMAVKRLSDKQELYNFLKIARGQFSTFREMCKFVDENPLARLRAGEDISVCPDTGHLKENLRQIGVMFGLYTMEHNCF